MPFLQRIKLFSIGVGLGCIMVYFLFLKDGKYRFNWLPNSRVTSAIADKFDFEQDKNNCFVNCLAVDNEVFLELIKTASVNFDESRPRDTPSYFQLNALHNKQSVILGFELHEKHSYLSLVKFDEENASCSCN